jgi:hypothetical protein
LPVAKSVLAVSAEYRQALDGKAQTVEQLHAIYIPTNLVTQIAPLLALQPAAVTTFGVDFSHGQHTKNPH